MFGSTRGEVDAEQVSGRIGSLQRGQRHVARCLTEPGAEALRNRRVARADVEADHLGRSEVQLTDGVERPVVGRRLLHHDVEHGVNVEQRRRRRAGDVVDIGGADDVGLLARVGVAGGVGKRSIGHRSAGVRIDAQVLARVADDSNAVCLRVEVDAELAAFERWAKGRADWRCKAAGDIDHVHLAGAADTVESAGQRSEVDADQALVGLEVRHRETSTNLIGAAWIEAQELVGVVEGYAHARRERSRLGSRGAWCQAAQQQAEGQGRRGDSFHGRSFLFESGSRPAMHCFT